MKIVHVITRLYRAGAEENTISTCLGQVAEGHDVTLIHGRDFTPEHYEALSDKLRLIEVRSLIREPSPITDLKCFFELKSIFNEIKPDFVHTHTSKAGFLGRLAARYSPARHIVHGVHIVPFDGVGFAAKLLYLALEKWVAPYTEAFVHVSQGTKDMYLAKGVGSTDRHHIIHSGFDLSRFKNGQYPDDWRTLLGISENEEKPFVVLMLAAFEPRKRHLPLIDAFSTVVQNTPNVRLLLPGEGQLKEGATRRAEEIGIAENVILPGYRTDPANLIALSDLCTLTSEKEGLPRVVMQYLAGNKPCIVNYVPGLEEILKDGVNGVVTAPDNVEQTCKSISHTLSSPELLKKFTDGAIQSDLSDWDVKTMCIKMNDLYREIENT